MREFIYKLVVRVEKLVKTQFSLKKGARSALGEVVGMGKNGTVTKRIDAIAENEILRLVTHECAKGRKINVLSEEAGFVNNGGTYTLVIDPIDGTQNAIYGVPFFAVSIALGREKLSDIEYAAVKNLATGDFFEAQRGSGAFLNGERIHVRNSEREKAMYAVYLGERAPPNAYEVVKLPACARSLGAAALEMALVASGALDVYCHFAHALRVTDIAAGTLLVREAGGEVYNEEGEVLEMPLSLAARTGVIATGIPSLLRKFNLGRRGGTVQ